MRIGEKMSEVVEHEIHDYVVHNNDYFESWAHAWIHKPLDSGRLLYFKLRREMAEEIKVEVYYNHFDNCITAHMQGRDRELETTFLDNHMPRAEKLGEINRLVEAAKGAESYLLS